MPAGTRKEVRPGCAFVLAGVVIGAIVGAVAGAASYDPSEDFFDFGQGFSAFAGGALGSLAGAGLAFVIWLIWLWRSHSPTTRAAVLGAAAGLVLDWLVFFGDTFLAVFFAIPVAVVTALVAAVFSKLRRRSARRRG